MPVEAEHNPQREFPFLPLSLHIETLGGMATPLVLRGTPLPCTRSEVFSTAEDNQKAVEIHVVMGESPLAEKNKTVGKFMLNGIPEAPKGIPQIRITYTVDRLCRINASAAIANSELNVVATLEDPQPLLGQSAIEAALKRAEADKEADQAVVREREARSQAHTALAKAESFLRAHATQKTATGRESEVSQRIAELGLALDGGNLEAIHTATQTLRNVTEGASPDLTALFGASFFGTTPRSYSNETEGAVITEPAPSSANTSACTTSAGQDIWRWGVYTRCKPVFCLDAVRSKCSTHLRGSH